MTLRIAVAGVGQVGRRHVERIAARSGCRLSAIVDPHPAAIDVARNRGVPHFASLQALLDADRPDALVLATPNRLHVEQALQCIAARIPVLVEKPLADTVEGARRICEAAEAAGVPVLVGHHRRYSAVMAAALDVIHGGLLGPVVAFVGTALFHKDARYFEAPNAWRSAPGGGPILINMVHEIDNARALCGEIASVHAFATSANRGFAVEDTAAIGLRFANGALGTFMLSDAAGSDRSWEHTSGEDPAYAQAHADDVDCYLVAGAGGSLAMPTMRLTRYLRPEDRSWHKGFDRSTVPVAKADPLERQIAHFVDVVRSRAAPRVGARDGLANLLVVDAIVESARTGRAVDIAGQGSSR